MVVSDTFRRKLREIFRDTFLPNVFYTQFNETGYAHSIELDISTDTIYCPMCLAESVFGYSDPRSIAATQDKVICYLGIPTPNIQEVSGGDTFLSKMCNRYQNNRLSSIRTKADQKMYFTIPGFIFDEDMNIIMEYGYVGDKHMITSYDGPSTPLYKSYKLRDAYIKVGYKVFEDPTLTIPKYIINKIIPYMLTKPTVVPYCRLADGDVKCNTLIIEEKVNSLLTPATLTINQLDNKNIREFLLKSSETIVNGLQDIWR